MEEMIKAWKDAEIAYAEFKFYCGGDCMGDTSIAFYDKNEKEIKDTFGLGGYFDDEIYNHVDFYVNSDGHYMGEYGTVTIELDDEDEDEEYFTYSKSAMAQISEQYDETIKFELTKEQAEFLQEYVSDMSGGAWRGEETNYKKDFVLTKEHEKMIEELHSLFYEKAEEWASEEYDAEEESERYEMNEIIESDGKFYAQLEVACNVIEEHEDY